MFVLILAVVLVTPVQAASNAVAKEKVVVSAPSGAVAGASFQATVTVSGEGRNELSLVFPKDVVAKVSCQSGGLTMSQTQQTFVYKLDRVLKPHSSYRYTFTVVLNNSLKSPSVATWLKISGKRSLLQVQTIKIATPTVTQKVLWNIAIPNSAVGNKPYSITVTVINNSSSSLPFDLSVKLLFDGGTNKSAYPQLTGGELYNAIGNSTGYEMFWRGTVPAGSSYTLNIQTASGTSTGTFSILTVKNVLYPMDPATTGKIVIVP
jgi:hypothetical protein